MEQNRVMLSRTRPPISTFTSLPCSRGTIDEGAYVAEYLVGLAGADCILLFGVACPVVQVGAIQNIAQHVLALLSHLVGNDVSWDVVLGLGFIVGLLVKPLK